MRQRRTYNGYVLMTRTEQSLLELHPAVNESRQAAIDVGYDFPSDATFRGACQRGSGHPGLAAPAGRAGAVAVRDLGWLIAPGRLGWLRGLPRWPFGTASGRVAYPLVGTP